VTREGGGGDVWVLRTRRGKDRWGDFDELCRAGSPSEFWSIHSATAGLAACSDLYFFREGSLPVWDHPSNRSGGCLSVRIEGETEIVDAWGLATASAMSGRYDRALGPCGRVNGVCVTRKGQRYVMKLWLSGASAAIRDACGAFVEPFEKGTRFRLNAEAAEGALEGPPARDRGRQAARRHGARRPRAE
jgi:hypothetical protein